jgi:NTE family protein
LALIKISELRKNALFFDVKVSELRRVLPTLQKEYYPRSAQICREGEPGSCIYIILSGQVKLTITENTHTKTLAYLNAGDFFGESSVLTGEPRTVTAEAVIDAEILLLHKTHFYEIVERDQTILHNIIRTIDKRIRLRTLGLFHQQLKQSQIVSVYSPKSSPFKTFLAVNLAVSLYKQTELPVVVLDMSMNDPGVAMILNMGESKAIGVEEITEEGIKQLIRRHKTGFHLLTMSSELLRAGKISREHIASTLSILKMLFQYVVINTSTEISNHTFESLDLSDSVVLLSPLGEEPPTEMFDHQDIINTYYFSQDSPNADAHLTEVAPLILPPSRLAEQRFYDFGEVILELDPHDEVSRTLDRVARHVAGLRVGLALGGIAARGISHIGVLKVLEENDIPIDMIAGSNTGAIIGTAYALGMSAADLEQLVLKWDKYLPLVSIFDFHPFKGGLLKNHRILKLISEFIPEHLTFHNLKIPLRIITMALDMGKEVPLTSGSLLKGIEASIAMPGIFPPVRYEDQYLVDGSTINPVPLSDLSEMGADILVGVNSFAPLTPSYSPPPNHYVNFVGYAENLKMIDIIIRSFQNLQYEISTAKAMIADVMIVPEVLGYAWNDFDKTPGILEAGRKAAEQMLPELKNALKTQHEFKTI